MRKNIYLLITGIFLLLLTSICLLGLLFIKKFSIDSLLMNLATDFIAAFITIFFIDRILKIHDNEKWKSVNLKINRCIQKLINGTISSVRNSFGYALDDICSDGVMMVVKANPEKNFSFMEKELIRISKEILEPTAVNNVQKMDRKSWNTLNINLKEIFDAAGSILSLFGLRINPDQFEILMDIQENVNRIFAIYTTFPDIIGVNDDELPTGGITPPIMLKRELNISIGKEIKGLLEKSRNLFETIK